MSTEAEQIESRAHALAEQLQMQGAPATRAGVDRYIARTAPELEPSTVLAYAVERDWLVVSDDGLTVRPGATQPPPVSAAWSGLSR